MNFSNMTTDKIEDMFYKFIQECIDAYHLSTVKRVAFISCFIIEFNVISKLKLPTPSFTHIPFSLPHQIPQNVSSSLPSYIPWTLYFIPSFIHSCLLPYIPHCFSSSLHPYLPIHSKNDSWG